MITAVDTSVLLDVFGADSQFGPKSRDTVRRCLAEGVVVACEVVWAEVSAAFPDERSASGALELLGVRFDPMGSGEAAAAGRAWHEYRQRGGGRDRVVADFLIAAHAAGRADRLLTRDRGFYRRYFGSLAILDPRPA